MNRFAARLLVTTLLLGGPLNIFAQNAEGAVSSDSQKPAPAPNVNPTGELPESPGTTKSTNQEAPPASISSPSHSNVAQQPTGAAAAPAVEVSGSVVSRPAGSAIAPPKQRQVRSFLIKMGLLAGAGVALGTVAALSLSSPARVPGSH
jgi:hypothetical protein